MPPKISLDEIDDDAGETAAPEPAASQRQTGSSSETPPPETKTAPPEDAEASEPKPSNLVTVAEPLPTDLKGAIETLKKAEALPHATKAQKAIRDAQLARLRPHVARLQEGVPTPIITGKSLGNYHHKLVSMAKRERLELLARANPEIAELLKERDDLAAAVEKVLADGHRK